MKPIGSGGWSLNPQTSSRGGAPISGLPEIGTSSTQVGYSRLAVRRLEGWPLARSRLWPSFETRTAVKLAQTA